tara:strand:+ start:3984 stop:5129 length:1146 start_codon:yes stop_codon:yes gene_type:complete
MGFLSTGMVIGLEEGFRTKQEEIADRQNQLTKDYRNEIKASIAKANDTIRTDRKKDEELLTISKGIISSISEDLPGLANKLKDLDQDTLIELGNTYLPLVKIEGASAATFKRYGYDLKNTIGAVQARDKQIREEKAKAAEMKTVEQQTQESFLDMFSPTRQGQIERDRINRGVTEEQREVMRREGAPKERRIIEGVAPQARELLNTTVERNIRKENDRIISQDMKETFKGKEVDIALSFANRILNIAEGDISQRDANNIPLYIKQLKDKGIIFDRQNLNKVDADMQKRGVKTVLDEIKKGEYEIPKPEVKSDNTPKKDDTDDTTVKESLKELLEKEGLTKGKTVRKEGGDGFIVTVTNKDKTKIFDVHVDKEFNVTKKVPK